MTVLQEKIYEYLAHDEYEIALKWLCETEGYDETQAINYINELIEKGKTEAAHLPFIVEKMPKQSPPPPISSPPLKISPMFAFQLGAMLTAAIIGILFFLFLKMLFSGFIELLENL